MTGPVAAHDEGCLSRLPDFDYRDCSCGLRPPTSWEPPVTRPPADAPSLADVVAAAEARAR